MGTAIDGSENVSNHKIQTVPPKFATFPHPTIQTFQTDITHFGPKAVTTTNEWFTESVQQQSQH
jgi:hypothetical protein